MHVTTTESRLRAYLLITLMVGICGTSIELLLLGHFDSVTQLIPLILLLLGAIVVGWHAARPQGVTVRAVQIVMVLFVVSGAVGVVLHLRGNAEFLLEVTPSMAGFELFRKTMTGATPALAPGSMTLLGVVGLLHSYRHPSLDAASDAAERGR